MQKKFLPIVASMLASVLLFTALLLLLGSVRTQAASLPVPHSGLPSAVPWQQQTYTPVVTITLPIPNAVLTTTHLPTYTVQVEYNCGTLCVGSALLDVVSVTVDGGVTYHEAISDGMLGLYIYDWILPPMEDYTSHMLIARASNGWGNIGASGPVTAYVDTIPPQETIITAPKYTENTSFTVSWSATDGSGVVKYDLQYRRDDQTSWVDWLTSSDTLSQVFTVTSQEIEEGHDYTFRMLARDIGNNRSDWVTATVRVGRYYLYLPLVLRNYPPRPAGSVDIKGGAITVHQRPVTLALIATVSGDTVTEMHLSNDGVNWSDWEPYTTTKSWTLASGISGLRTVYAHFKGSQGGVSELASDQIYLLSNGSFETSDFTAWQHGGELHQSVNADRPHIGTYSALLGNPSYPNENVPEGSAWAYQTIEVPNTGTPTLNFWYRIFTYDVMWSDYHQCHYDYFDVYVQDINGQTLAHILRDGYTGTWEPDTLQDLGWRHFSYDLSTYAGQTIRIHFANFNTPGTTSDPGLNTYTYLDDVTIEGGW